MKIAFSLMTLILIPMSAHALPEGMAEALADAKKDYAEYAKKEADEILDHLYDDSEASLLGRLDLGDMYNTAPEAYADALEYRLQTVKDLAWAFKTSQLEALPQMIEESSKELDNDAAARARNSQIVRLALQWKKSKLNEAALREALTDGPFRN